MEKLQKLFKAVKSTAGKVGVAAGATVASGLALAGGGGGPDVSGAVSAFTQAGTSIQTVGAAMVVAAAAGIVYRWVTAFLVK